MRSGEGGARLRRSQEPTTRAKPGSPAAILQPVRLSAPFDDAAAEAYGEIRIGLERAGTPIGPNDLCIAAIAKSNGLTLVSHNSSAFGRVQGLQLDDWE